MKCCLKHKLDMIFDVIILHNQLNSAPTILNFQVQGVPSFFFNRPTWCLAAHAWAVADGEFGVMVGSSSTDIRLRETVRIGAKL